MPPARPKLTERKRAAIIRAAAQEFQAQGFQSTSMDRIAACAEVSKRTVYNHFPSKDELFLAIAGEVCQQTIQATDISYDPEKPVEKQLAQLGEQKLKLLASPDYMGLTRMIVAECIRSPKLAQETFGQFKADDDKLIDWLKRAVADRRLSIRDTSAAADQFWALVKGPRFFPLLLKLTEPPTAHQRKAMVKQAVSLFLCQYGVK